MAHDDRKLEGVGGWLTFFLVTLGVFTPLGAVVGTLIDTSAAVVDPALADRWPAVLAGEWAMVALAVAACWFAAFRMIFVRNRQSVRITIGVLVLIALLAVLQPMMVSMLLGSPAGRLFATTGADLVRPLVYAVLWTAYLLRSRRVANTYAPETRADAAGQA